MNLFEILDIFTPLAFVLVIAVIVVMVWREK